MGKELGTPARGLGPSVWEHVSCLEGLRLGAVIILQLYLQGQALA